jgi:hypothetical protein
MILTFICLTALGVLSYTSLWRLDTLYKEDTYGRVRYDCALHAGIDLMHLGPGIVKTEYKILSGKAKDGGVLSDADKDLIDERSKLLHWPSETRGRIPRKAGRQASLWTCEQRIRFLVTSSVVCLIGLLFPLEMEVGYVLLAF